MTDRRRALALVAALVVAIASPRAAARNQTSASLTDLLPKLGALDFATRTKAAQTFRRAAATEAIPVLTQAARSNADGYVRYEALVLLSGFGPDAANAVMREAMADKNDRLRAVAYAWFEHHPQASLAPTFAAALATEQSEFVRPALTRALAATKDEARITATLVPLVERGVNYFRSGVIEALGDYGVKSAVSAILAVAQLEGPLQENAIEALGKIGDRSVVPTLAAIQSKAPFDLQPALFAALMQLGAYDQRDRLHFLDETLQSAAIDSGREALTEASAHALAVLAVQGTPGALDSLLRVAESAKEPARSPIALAVGYVALRRPEVVLGAVRERAARPATLTLLRDAFDILSDEDFERECFYTDVRRIYWAAPEGSPDRQTAQAVIAALEF
jgi:HEAT repeat protein